MCGGVTAYTACKRSAVKPGQWVVILGAGGGLGHFGVQYAKAMGMRVIAVDGGDEKRKLCLDKLGAEKFIDFQTEKVEEKVTEYTKYGCVSLVRPKPLPWMCSDSSLTFGSAHGCIVYSAAAAGYKMAPNLVSHILDDL